MAGPLLWWLLLRDVLYLRMFAILKASLLEPLHSCLFLVVKQYPCSGLEFLHEFLVLASALD